MGRIILYTGKGGVGKTTVAAATALQAAKKGHRVLVISTDAAHSLRDVFDQELGPEPKKVAKNVYAQEIDVYYSVDKYWGKLTSYIQSLFNWMQVDDILAEEFSVFPGMEEVASFLWVYNHYKENQYDLIIVDSAPTGETLKLLSLPDVARWWLVKVFPIERRVLKVIRPAVKVVTDMPLPEEDTYDAVENLFSQLNSIHQIFSDPDITSIRLVLNLEKMVINETQRAYTYLNLYGYPVDSAIVNRVMPKELDHPYFNQWKEFQKNYMKDVRELFNTIPIHEAPLLPKEILGKDALLEFGKALYSDKDPAQIFYKGKPYEILKEGESYSMILKLPFVSRKEVKLHQVGDELTIQIENQRRNIFLPKFLAKLNVDKANLENGVLKVTFEKPKDSS
ncbi:MAG: TRC40/GET3/ArsA family transport-energizing ATPase [Candidatus Dadabacteria bacterium]|nr:TRC40/GET3/ArsA family transport-energizing ATPase [Candidatus Dadabacteria bacterium]